MGTLADTIAEVRLRIQESDVQYFSNAQMLSLANAKIKEFRRSLRNIDCKLPLVEDTITVPGDLTAGAYAISGKFYIVPSLVKQSDGSRVPRYSEEDSDEFSYNETSSGITFYNYSEIEDDLTIAYWSSATALTYFSTDDLPWDGLANEAIRDSIVMQCKIIRRHRFKTEALIADDSWSSALADCVKKYGTIRRQQRGQMYVSQ